MAIAAAWPVGTCMWQLPQDKLSEKTVTPFQVNVGEACWTAAVECRNTFITFHESEVEQPPLAQQLVRSKTAPAEVHVSGCHACERAECPAVSTPERCRKAGLTLVTLTETPTETDWAAGACKLDDTDLELPIACVRSMDSSTTWKSGCTTMCAEQQDAASPEMQSVLESYSNQAQVRKTQMSGSWLCQDDEMKKLYYDKIDADCREALCGIPHHEAVDILKGVIAKDKGDVVVRRHSAYIKAAVRKWLEDSTGPATTKKMAATGLADAADANVIRSPTSAAVSGAQVEKVLAVPASNDAIPTKEALLARPKPWEETERILGGKALRWTCSGLTIGDGVTAEVGCIVM